MAYAKLDDLKRYLDIDLELKDDGLLQRSLDAGKRAIDSHTQRRFAVDCAETMMFRLSEIEDGCYLYFWDLDLAEYHGVSLSHCSYQCPMTVFTIDARIAPFYGLEFCEPIHGSACGCGNNCKEMIGVIGKWGYSVTPPDDIVQANIRLSAWFYRQKDSHVDLSAVASSSDGTVIIPSGLPRDVTQMLKPYRRVVR